MSMHTLVPLDDATLDSNQPYGGVGSGPPPPDPTYDWPTQGAMTGLPIIRGARGHAMGTFAGSGRGGGQGSTNIYRVQNTSGSAAVANSLPWCIAQHNASGGPSTIVFETSGICQVDGALKVTQPYLSIWGETAPNPGFIIRNGMFEPNEPDVMISHMRIFMGDDPAGESYTNRDCVEISEDPGNLDRIVVANCSLAWSTDEMLSCWRGFNKITVWQTALMEPLVRNNHGEWQSNPNGHGFGPIVDQGDDEQQVNFLRCLFAHMGGRQPQARNHAMYIADCAAYNPSAQIIDLRLRASNVRLGADIVNYVTVHGPDSGGAVDTIRVNSDVTSASTIFYNGVLRDIPANGASRYSNSTGDILLNLGSPTFVGAPQFTPEGYVPFAEVNANSADEFMNTLYGTLGARPSDRDALTADVIQHIKNRRESNGGDYGQHIDYLDYPNVGYSRTGRQRQWSILDGTENTRAYVTPSDPDGIHASGYTNLEEDIYQNHTLAMFA